MEEKPKTQPFCYQYKAPRRFIRTSLDATNDVASGLGVYDALTEIASDAGSEEFQTTIAWIASMSGFSKRTVQSRLADLEQLKLVEIRTPPLRAPSTYRLLPYGNDCATQSNGCRTLSNGCAAHGNRKVSPLPPSEERQKKGNREPAKPLTTAQRIGLEGKARMLKEKLADLKADMHYEFDRTPEKIAQRDQLQNQLDETEDQLLRGVI